MGSSAALRPVGAQRQSRLGMALRNAARAAVAASAITAAGVACAAGWGWPDQFSAYAGHGADHDLPGLPTAIVRGPIRWEDARFVGVGAGREIGSLADSFHYGYEVILLKHHGLQHNGELGAAWTLRAPPLQWGPVGVDFMAGAGASYALGRPTYEDGPVDNPSRRYRLQFLALFELQWRLAQVEHWSLVTRVHHRSGIYGIVAPRHVGSNFLVAGIRYHF
jgi:hypothetical protein